MEHFLTNNPNGVATKTSYHSPVKFLLQVTVDPLSFSSWSWKKNKNLRLRKSTRGRWEIGKKKSILEATSLQHMPNPDMANFPFSSDQKLMPKNYNLNTRSVLQEEDLYTSTQTIAKNYRCCQMLNIIYNYMYCIYTYIYIILCVYYILQLQISNIQTACTGTERISPYSATQKPAQSSWPKPSVISWWHGSTWDHLRPLRETWSTFPSIPKINSAMAMHV